MTSQHFPPSETDDQVLRVDIMHAVSSWASCKPIKPSRLVPSLSVDLVDLQLRLHTSKRQRAVGGLFSDIFAGEAAEKEKKAVSRNGKKYLG